MRTGEGNVLNFHKASANSAEPDANPTDEDTAPAPSRETLVPDEPTPVDPHTEPVDAHPSAGNVPAVRRRSSPARRQRARTGGDLIRQSERRSLRLRTMRTALVWISVHAWWVIRGVGVTLRAVWRIVWQPEMPDLIRATAETSPDRARTARKDLRKERRNAVLWLLALGASAYGGAYFWGTTLLASMPWWIYPVAVLVLVPSLAYAGRPAGKDSDNSEDPVDEMPPSLALASSDRGVAATVTEAFADAKIRAKVDHVRREAGGWGWTARLSILDSISEAKLEALERFLNVPVGGLIFSPDNSAARIRHLRIVMEDLLVNPTDAPERPPTSVHVPAELATRFDGGRLCLELFARHMLIVGRTGSGKSGVLLDIADALTSMTDVIVDGLDLSGGPDLRSFEKSLRRYVGGPNYGDAEALLAEGVTILQDRTTRLGSRNWDPAIDGPGHAIIIDEYGMVAEHPRLRAMVEFIVKYGAKAGVWVILANQRAVKDIMGSTLIGSQVHIKIYLGMAAEDVLALPKALREQGVRPHLFQQATLTDPNDAGKGFVIGVDALPILVRFDRIHRAEAERRSNNRVAERPDMCGRDQEVIRRHKVDGVPELLLVVREAIIEIAGAAHRAPERASGEEIVAYLNRHGWPVEKGTLIREIRKLTGGLISKTRDTNLAPGNNPKGLYLDAIDNAIRVMRNASENGHEG